MIYLSDNDGLNTAIISLLYLNRLVLSMCDIRVIVLIYDYASVYLD